MNREIFKKEFTEELTLFNVTIVKRYLDKGYTEDQVVDILIPSVSSFYGSLMSVDDYAEEKAYFIATFANQIVKGNINKPEFKVELDKLCDEIEEREKISGISH